MITFFKKYWLLVFLAGLAITLAVFWIQPKETSQKQNLPNLPFVPYPNLQGQSVPVSVSFALQTPTLPSQVSTYQISSRSLAPDQSKTLAKSFGFPENPSTISTDTTLGDNYLWLSGSKSLVIRLSPIDINFVQDPGVEPPPTDGELPSEQASLTFITNLLSLNNLTPSGASLAIGGSRKIRDDTILELRIDPTVENIKIIDNNPITSLVTAYIGKDGNVYSLLYKSGFSNPTKPSPYPAKTLDQIKESIVKEGKVVYLGEPLGEPEFLVPSSITIIKIESALLYYPPNPTILYPIYALTGTAQTNIGEQPVYIYLPAVHSKYVGPQQ